MIHPYPPKNTFLPEEKRQRFLEELNNHVEDAGTSTVLGTTEELIESYRVYSRSRNIFKITLLILLCSYILFSTLTVYHNVSTDTGISWLPDSLEMLFMITGCAFLMPLVYLFGVVLVVIDWLPINHTYSETWTNISFAIAPFLATVFWGTAVFMIMFSPKETPHNDEQNTKYEVLKRNS